MPETARKQVRFVWLERVDDAVAAALDPPGAAERPGRARRHAGATCPSGRALGVMRRPTLAADPYATLGVKKDASQEDIQKAYRQLAKKLHPDLNPGNKQAEEQFKDVSAAYDVVGDADKRARFDRGEIDASGAERPRQRYYRDFAESGASHPYGSDAGFADFTDADDILSQIFAPRRPRQCPHAWTGRPLPPCARLPRCRQRRQAADHAPGRVGARRHDSRRHARRPDPAAARQGKAGARRWSRRAMP